MIQKCPNCGQWCEADKQNVLDRYGQGWEDAVNKSAEVGGSILGIFGKTGRKFGETFGAVVGGQIGHLSGAANAALGDKFNFECPNCGYTWSANYDFEDQSDEYIHEQEMLENAVELVKKTSSLMHHSKNEISEHIREMESLLANETVDENNTVKGLIYDALAYSYDAFNIDPVKAMGYIKKSLELWPDDVTSKAIFGMIMDVADNPYDNYETMKWLISYKEIDVDNSITHFTQDQFYERFECLTDAYLDNFLEIPVNKRRYLILDDYLRFLPDSSVVLPIDRIPQGLQFPLDSPRIHEVYVVHPYKPNCYYPFNEYQYAVFHDEINEFKWIMECLGAKSISFHEEIENEKNTTTMKEAKSGGGVDYAGKFSANGSYERGGESKEYIKLINELKEEKNFALTPTILPYLPQDLVWYNHRPEWHRNCESRMMGRLSKASFRMSTSSITTASGQEKKKIEADLKILLFKANGNHEQESEVTLETNDNHTWSVDVEFYPMNEYEAKSQSINLQSHASPLLSNSKSVTPTKNNKYIIIGLVSVIIILLAIVIGLFLK